jgi:hypothetical protein
MIQTTHLKITRKCLPLNCRFFGRSHIFQNLSYIVWNHHPLSITAFMGKTVSTYVVSTNAVMSRNHRRRPTWGAINLNKYTSATGRRNVYSMLWPLCIRRCNSDEIKDAEASYDSGERGQEEIPAPVRTYPVVQPVVSHFKDRRVPINSIQNTHERQTRLKQGTT